MKKNFEKYTEIFLKQSCEFLREENRNQLYLNMDSSMCRLGDRRGGVRINSGRRMIDLMNYI